MKQGLQSGPDSAILHASRAKRMVVPKLYWCIRSVRPSVGSISSHMFYCGIKLVGGTRVVTVTLIGHVGIKVHVLYDFCADGGTSDNRF